MQDKATLLAELQETKGLIEVNKLISSCFESEAEQLSQIAEYLFALRGKQIRPILTLMTAKAAGLQDLPEDLIKISAGIELIHLATILHDDIIDNSDLRRNKESANKKYGVNPTLLTGDFLLVRAFGLCGQLSPAIVAATEQACVELTEGEVLEAPLYQESESRPFDLNFALMIARKKTAALFRLAAFCAANIAGCNQQQQLQFAKFGEDIGIAFQILDDILDVSADQQRFGKKIGTDIREQKPSTVNLLWLATGKPESLRLCDAKPLTDQEVAQQVELIKSSDVLKQAQNLATAYADQAMESLNAATEDLPNSCKKSLGLLKSLIEFTILRSK